MMTRNPEIESTKLCTASEAMAIEFEMRPMTIFKTASRKFVRINKYPDFKMARLRVFSICLF